MKRQLKMRGSKEVPELEALAGRTTFPVYNSLFNSYKNRLRELVVKNFGYSVKDTFDYDEDKQQFYFRVEPAMSIFRVGNTRFRAEMWVAIDPKLPVEPQFALAREKIKQMTAHFIFAYRVFKNAFEAGEIKEEVE